MIEQTVLNLGIILSVILISMTLHEAMHGFVAYWLGDDTARLHGRLTLNPIKHIDPFLTILLPLMLALIGGPIFGGAKPVPFNPGRLRYGEWGAALVALAGPMTNFVIAFLCFGLSVLAGYDILSAQSGGILETFLLYGVVVNLGFFVFNMIPLPPLDGSRVIYALAPEFIRRGMEWIEQYGLILVFAVVLLGSNIIGVIMGTVITAIVELFSKIFML